MEDFNLEDVVSDQRPETLAILAIFRNEAPIMEEWIEHHINGCVVIFLVSKFQSFKVFPEG